jgi:hypothetical protein
MGKFYINPNYEFIVNKFIYEYDIQQGNINVMKRYGLIEDNLYDALKILPKEERNRKVGLLIQNNKELSEALSSGFTEVVDNFISINNILPDDILSVKNDAVFLVNRKPMVTQFDNINFIEKNRYNLFNRIGALETYYQYDIMADTEKLDIKGIKDTFLELHKDYMLDFICHIYYLVMTGNVAQAIVNSRFFYQQYSNRSLNVNYYRELNHTSKFNIYNKYGVNTCDDVNNIKIGYNKKILTELNKFLSKIYY